MLHPRAPYALLARVLPVVLVLAGCGLLSDEPEGDGDGEDSARSAESPETVDTRPTNEWTLPGGQAEVSLHRVDDEHMVAQMTLTNEGDRDIPGTMESLYFLLSDEFYGDDEQLFTGIGWLAPGGRVLHKPYQGEDDTCLCSDTGDAITLSSEGEGNTWEGHAVMQAPPADVDELTVVTAVAAPFVNVPVQEGAPEGLDYTAPEDAPDAEPQPADLEAVVDSGDETLVDDSRSTDINLSTDVLFEIDESELTGDADALIEDAAARIEESGATEVEIEGHADSTGTDEINHPLSEERAEAVRDRLEESVDADVAYTTEGFGSKEPIADDDSEEGRERNRRVTIRVPKETAGEQEGRESAGAGDPGQGEGTPAGDVSFTGSADDPDNAGAEVQVDLTDLRAVTDSTALLTYRVTNPTNGDVQVGLDMGRSWMEFRTHSAHGVTLESGDETAHPMRVEAPEGGDYRPSCLCTSSSGRDLGALILKPDETHEFYAMLPITPGATVADVDFGEIGTAEEVAIA